MFELVDLLIALGVGAGAASFFRGSDKKEKNETKDVGEILQEKLDEVRTTVKHNSYSPVIEKNPIEPQTVHRLDALENLLEQNGPLSISTELMSVKMMYITDGIRYHFHYLNRPLSCLTLTFHHATQQVVREYVMDELLQDKGRTKEIVRRLSEKIVEEHGKQTKNLQKLEEHKDPVFKKAHRVLVTLKNLETLILPSESEAIKQNVQSILDAYEPLKEETKKACQDDVFIALGKLEDRLKEQEEKDEKEKIKRLKEQIEEL